MTAEYSRVMVDHSSSEPIMTRSERHRQERAAVDEAGGGESEGFELAEQDLIEHASHGDEHTPARIMRDAGPDEPEARADDYGDADGGHQND
jgi:hypothetical protein